MPPRREQLNQSEPMTQEQKERLTRLLRGTKLSDEEREKFFKVLNREKAEACIDIIVRYKKDDIIVIEQRGLHSETSQRISSIRRGNEKAFIGAANYLFIEVLEKSGGLSEVSVGIDLSDGLPVAFKTLKPELEGKLDIQDRLEREGRVQKESKNDHIIEVKNVLRIEKYNALVLEFMDPKKSYALDDIPQAMPYEQIVKMVREVGKGLKNLHKRGRLHRDIKPANLFFNGQSFQVGDFGSVTEVGEGSFTPIYTAPEVWRFNQSSIVSETFAIALVVYFCMTKENLFGQNTKGATIEEKLIEVGREIVHGDHVALLVQNKKLRAYFPDGDWGDRIFNKVVTTLSRAISRNKNDRYKSFDDLADDLEKDFNTK